MKKTKIVGCLSSAFVVLMALASCQSIVKDRGNIVLTYNGHDYTADELFEDQKSSASYEAKFNAVLKVAVRNWAKNGAGTKYEEEVTNSTKVKISGQKSVAQSNADKNGTTFDTEWAKILTSNKVEDEAELYDKFEYEYQKEKFDEDFNDANFDTFKKGGDIYKDESHTIHVDGYIPKKQPYHVKHILVKVGAAEKDYRTGEITADQAKKLSRVIKRLASGENFSTVAKDESEDTGSASKGGDLGIMDRDTSYVNEFKLGTYVFESFFDKNTSAASAEGTKYHTKKATTELFKDDLTTEGTAGNYASKVANLSDPTNGTGNLSGLGVIPFEAALMLGDEKYYVGEGLTEKKGVADIDYDKAELKSAGVVDNKASFYPRNVIFNKYFNKRNIMVIGNRTVQAITPSEIIGTGKIVSEDGTKLIASDSYIGTNSTFYADSEKKVSYNNKFLEANNSKFKNEDGLISSVTLNSSKLLCDNEDRPILVFRSGTSGDQSYQGIHFVVIERSPFIGNEYSTDKPYDTSHPDRSITLDDYFTKYYPGQSSSEQKYPTYSEDNKEKKTYVNYLEGKTTDYKERADAVKSKVKSYDSNSNIYVYQYLVYSGKLKFNGTRGETIQKEIDDWCTRKIEDTEYSTTKTWNETWKTYYTGLEEQAEQRKQVQVGTYYINGIISEACAVAYADYYWNKETGDIKADGMKKLFNAGGVFHE